MSFQVLTVVLGLRADDFRLQTWRAVLAELIGTGLFVFIGAGSVITVANVLGWSPQTDIGGLVAIALAHGFAIIILVSATAKISGGHLNPAVTFAAVISGRQKLSTGILYITAQILGAVFGALLLKGIFLDGMEGALGAHAVNLNAIASAEMGMVVEIILTFLLVFVVFATAMDTRGLARMAPIAIGLAVLVDHLIGVPLTGASMNPARSFGPAAIANFWDNHWIYWAGPLIGGGLAGVSYTFIYLLWRKPEE